MTIIDKKNSLDVKTAQLLVERLLSERSLMFKLISCDVDSSMTHPGREKISRHGVFRASSSPMVSRGSLQLLFDDMHRFCSQLCDETKEGR